MSRRFERFDARPGRSYRLLLPYTDASTAPGKTTADSDIVEARLIELVPGVQAVQAVDFVSDDPRQRRHHGHDLGAHRCDAATRVGIRAEHVPAGISAEDHAAGLSSSLANLAALLERWHRGTSRVSSRPAPPISRLGCRALPEHPEAGR
jgi:hypothetical protein